MKIQHDSAGRRSEKSRPPTEPGRCHAIIVGAINAVTLGTLFCTTSFLDNF